MPICARHGCEKYAKVKYCSRLCGCTASQHMDPAARMRAVQRSADSRKKHTMQSMLARSGALLEAPGFWEALTAKDRARVLALLARGYRRGYDAGYQSGWQKGNRAERKRQQEGQAA